MRFNSGSTLQMFQINFNICYLIVLSLLKLNLHNFLIYLLAEGSLWSTMTFNFSQHMCDSCHWWLYEAISSVSAVIFNCFVTCLTQCGKRLQALFRVGFCISSLHNKFQDVCILLWQLIKFLFLTDIWGSSGDPAAECLKNNAD